jgi:hypothetical protein
MENNTQTQNNQKVLYKFWGKYGEWIEEHTTKENAQTRAYALNVEFEKVE